MKILAYIMILMILFSTINVSAQESKVKLALDVSNNNIYCFFSGSLYNLTTANLGIDVNTTKGNIRIYGTYGFNTYILLPSDSDSYSVKSFTIKSHYLGGTIEYYLLNERKKFRPYIGISLLTEIASNYRNKSIAYKWFYPIKYLSYPISTTIYQGHGTPSTIVYGLVLYQSTPILFNLNGGCSFRIIENFRLNLSLGYSLSVLNYKYVEWTDHDVLEDMIKRTPIEKKVLHSIADQIGLNYVFSFKKKTKTP